MTRSKFVIADDQLIVRTILRLQLEDAGYDVIADVSSAFELMNSALAQEANMIVMDFDMPGDSLQAIRHLKRSISAPRILVFSSRDDSSIAKRCLSCGADGFLNKSVGVEGLCSALKLVESGQTHFAPSHP